MKLSLNRADLAEALSVVGNVTPTRTPKPILQCVLFEAHKDHVTLCATDLDIGVRLSVGQVEVERTGTVLVAADKLSQIVRESTEEALDFELGDNVCHIQGRDSHFQIHTQDPKAFPPVAEMGDELDFEIDAGGLRRFR